MSKDLFRGTNRKGPWGEVLVVSAVSLLMSLGLFLWNPYAGVAGLVGTIFLSVHSYMREREAEGRAIAAIETLDYHFEK